MKQRKSISNERRTTCVCVKVLHNAISSSRIHNDKMATKQQKIHFKYWTEEDCRNQNKDEEVEGGRQQPGMVSLQKCSLINLCTLPQASLQLEQLYIENKSGVWWDDPGVACCSIGHIWCAGDFSPLAEAHLCNSFFPALYDLHPANLELEGFVPVSRRVKLFPILQHTYVMNNTRLSFLWKCSPITGRYCLDFYAHGCAT